MHALMYMHARIHSMRACMYALMLSTKLFVDFVQWHFITFTLYSAELSQFNVCLRDTGLANSAMAIKPCGFRNL